VLIGPGYRRDRPVPQLTAAGNSAVYGESVSIH